MAENIMMPKLAMAMKQGKVVEWKVKQGEWVEKDQVVMVIQTEKVTYDCEAPASGFLHILVPLDEEIPVNETVALLAQTEDELAQLQANQPSMAGTDASPEPGEVENKTADAPVDSAKKGKVKITPAAKKLAKTNNFDFQNVAGTGPGGRIVKKDIILAMETAPAADAPAVSSEAASATTEEAASFQGKRVKKSIPLKGMRQAIADHMVQSLSQSAQLTLAGEIDMTEMIRYRTSLVQQQETIGQRISYTDLLVYVLAKAIKMVPIVNSSIADNEIKIWEDINIAVAVSLQVDDAESGLIVPVVKDAGNKSLLEISRCIKDLATRAHSGELTVDDISDGTLTLSNTGIFAPGWTVSTPIINQPQSVIIVTGGIVDKPVVVEGEIVIRPIMTASVTFDHRVMDGEPINKFLGKFKDLIEQPSEMLNLY